MSLSFSQMNSYSRQQNFVGKKQLGPIFLQRIAGYQLLSHDSQIICSLNSLHSINRECLQPDDPRDQCEQKLFHLLFHHLIRWPNNILEANKHQCSVGYCQIQTARQQSMIENTVELLYYSRISQPLLMVDSTPLLMAVSMPLLMVVSTPARMKILKVFSRPEHFAWLAVPPNPWQ